jgi:hypothetical protein
MGLWRPNRTEKIQRTKMSSARIIGTVPAAPIGFSTIDDGKKKIQNAVARTRNGTFPPLVASTAVISGAESLLPH